MSRSQRGIRGGTRIPIELPVSIRWSGPGGVERRAEATTANISGNGLFIQTSLRWNPDTELQLTVLLPAEVAKVPIHLYCEGRAIRQQEQSGTAGAGVIIDDYNLLSSSRRASGRRIRQDGLKGVHRGRRR